MEIKEFLGQPNPTSTTNAHEQTEPDGPPTYPSPFISLSAHNPPPPPSLKVLILSDIRAVPQRITQLSEWLADHDLSFKIGLILVVGVSRPYKRTDIPHVDAAELGNDSITLGELEQICARVVYVPGLYDAPENWDSDPPSLSPFSLNAIRGPVHIAEDLYVVHRRYVDGLSEKPVNQLPQRWRQTLYTKLARPRRFRVPPKPSAIVLSSSQLPHTTSCQRSMGFFRTVRSLLSITRAKVPKLDFILTIAPPKVQRLPSSSNVFHESDVLLGPSSFAEEGAFLIADLERPAALDPLQEPFVDDIALSAETAWEVVKTSVYNIDEKPSHKHDEHEME